MVRSMECMSEQNGQSDLTERNGLVPIIAVSAPLVEAEWHTYADAGFDAWILKPFHLGRLSVLMSGIYNDKERNTRVYKPGR